MAGVIGRLWSDLPVDVLHTIVECLHCVDQIQFRLVCKSWRSNTYAIKHAADKLPWVMSFNEYDGKDSDGLLKQVSYNSPRGSYLYDPSQKKKYTIHNCLLRGAIRIHASKHGWLLLSPWMPHSSIMIFSTPFTHKIVPLPELHMMGRRSKATFSTAPTSPDCLIFVLTVQSKKLCASVCSPGDKKWKNHWFDGDHGRIDSVAYVGGAFYCLFSKAVMASFKVEQGEWRIHQHPSRIKDITVTDCLIDHRLIESHDNNLFATCATLHIPEQVFRYDQAEMRWSTVENLADRMLFLGITSMSLPAVGEASDSANTIHRAAELTILGGCGSDKCFSYDFYEPHKRLVKTYDWIDEPHVSNKIWVQPIQHT